MASGNRGIPPARGQRAFNLNPPMTAWASCSRDGPRSFGPRIARSRGLSADGADGGASATDCMGASEYRRDGISQESRPQADAGRCDRPNVPCLIARRQPARRVTRQGDACDHDRNQPSYHVLLHFECSAAPHAGRRRARCLGVGWRAVTGARWAERWYAPPGSRRRRPLWQSPAARSVGCRAS